MSSRIEFTPFPEDERLKNDPVFCEMVLEWGVHLDFDLGEIDLGDAEKERKTTREVSEDLVGIARSSFPDENPYHIVLKARWIASNLYEEQNRILAENDQEDTHE